MPCMAVSWFANPSHSLSLEREEFCYDKHRNINGEMWSVPTPTVKDMILCMHEILDIIM